MLDLIYMQVVASLLENEVDLSSKSSDELAKLITPIRSKPSSRKEIVMMINALVNRLLTRKTTFDTLVQIKHLHTQLTSIKHATNMISFHLPFVRVATKSLYERVEFYFLSEIGIKLYKTFYQMKTGNFDEERFISYITRPSRIVFEEPREIDQMSLFVQDGKCSQSLTWNDHVSSVSKKLENQDELLSFFYEHFSTLELKNYCIRLVEVLDNSSLDDSTIISNAIVKFCGSIYQYRSPKKKERPSNQMTISMIKIDHS